jgi:ribosomal protein S18 acetylase RimI-like enzyme
MQSGHIAEIRAAVPADAASVRALVRAAYAKWVPILGREPMPMKADYERAVREHQIDILSIEGRMVGLIETMLRADHLWIENIAIAPANQNQGLGRRLLAHAEARAAAAGRVELRLLTSSAFEANLALYRAVGYEIERTEPFMGGTTVHMRKTVAGSGAV